MHRAHALSELAEREWRDADAALVETLPSYGEPFDAAANAEMARRVERAELRRRHAAALADRWATGTTAGAALLARIDAELVDVPGELDAATAAGADGTPSEPVAGDTGPPLPTPATTPAEALITAPNAPGAGHRACRSTPYPVTS